MRNYDEETLAVLLRTLPAPPVAWDDWSRAWLVYSSHPPVEVAPEGRGFSAEQIWRAGADDEVEAVAGRGVPVVRKAAEPPLPPVGAARGAVLRVRVERGGVVHWSFQPQRERSVSV